MICAHGERESITLSVGLGPPARPNQRIAQDEPWLETTTGGHRGPGNPYGQREIP